MVGNTSWETLIFLVNFIALHQKHLCILQFFVKIENVIENTTYESHPTDKNAEVHKVEKVIGKFPKP